MMEGFLYRVFLGDSESVRVGAGAVCWAQLVTDGSTPPSLGEAKAFVVVLFWLSFVVFLETGESDWWYLNLWHHYFSEGYYFEYWNLLKAPLGKVMHKHGDLI